LSAGATLKEHGIDMVTVLADNDDAGRKLAPETAAALKSQGIKATACKMSSKLPEKADFCDLWVLSLKDAAE